MTHLRILKHAKLRRKLATYLWQANNYNTEFLPDPPLPTPTLKEIEKMDIGDPFMDCGSLTHPTEPWAVDPDTQQGIQAYLTYSRCTEELERISMDTRQMLNWAISYQARLDTLAVKINQSE